MAFVFNSRLPRRHFLAGAAYGLTALLDGDGMVRIPAGEFQMGSANGEADEAPVHPAHAGGATVGSNPSHFKGAPLPLESVRWDDIQVFLARLNARDHDHTYRLTTEAEWECACKDDSAGFAGRAWYKDNSGDRPQPVGGKQPGAHGLYDTLGNVAGWVQDWYGREYYAESPAPDLQGSHRVSQTLKPPMNADKKE